MKGKTEVVSLMNEIESLAWEIVSVPTDIWVKD